MKILIYDSDKISNLNIETILLQQQFRNILSESEIKCLSSILSKFQPDIIITSFSDIDFSSQLLNTVRQINETPVIIWSDSVNEKIVNYIFQLKNVFYIRKSEDNSFLIETISKLHTINN